jgi:polyisoprenoid-binding protein YceI
MQRATGWMLCGTLLSVGVFVADVSAAEYKLSGDNTKIEFLGTKSDGNHAGSFPKLSGTFDLGDDATKSKITVKIDAESLESDDPKLTAHLKSPDFFETKKYPEAKFVSKSVKADKDGYLVTGDLTLHGKTKEISFPAKIEKKDGAATLTSEFTINRSDWGISYGAGKIDEAVKLTIKVKAK